MLKVWSGEAATKKGLSVWSAKMGHNFLCVVRADGNDRFLLEVHSKLRPVETAVTGVLLAGTAQMCRAGGWPSWKPW